MVNKSIELQSVDRWKHAAYIASRLPLSEHAAAVPARQWGRGRAAARDRHEENAMRVDVQLSTRFLTTQNAHQVGMLVTLTGETPVRRAPINVALVLDRSGSMAGQPLESANDAARRFAGFLSPDDRLAVVT